MNFALYEIFSPLKKSPPCCICVVWYVVLHCLSLTLHFPLFRNCLIFGLCVVSACCINVLYKLRVALERVVHVWYFVLPVLYKYARVLCVLFKHILCVLFLCYIFVLYFPCCIFMLYFCVVFVLYFSCCIFVLYFLCCIFVLYFCVIFTAYN